MQQKAINIQGISSYLGPSSVADGQCIDVVNTRNVGGMIKPVCKEKIVADLMAEISGTDPNGIVDVYFHAKAKRYIALYNDGNGFSFIEYDDKYSFIGNYSFPDKTDVVSLNFIGNIMVVFHVDKTVFYLFRDNKYEYLGEKPPMPVLRMSIERKIYKHTHSVDYAKVPSEEKYWMYAIKGMVDACIYKGNKDSCYLDRTLVRFALRMYDGSYVMHSGIYLVEDDCAFHYRDVGGDEWTTFKDSNIFYNIVTGESKVYAWVKMFKLDYHMSNLTGLDKWRDLIVGIDVFTTRSIRSETERKGVFPIKEDKPTSEGAITINIEDKNLISEKVSYYDRDDDLRAKILSEANFYKVASFDLKGNRIESNSITDTSDENLALLPTLTDDNGTHDSLASLYPYVYNSKLHLGGCKQRLFAGYDSTQFIEYGFYKNDAPGDKTLIPDQNDRTEIDIYVYLKTLDGDKVVRYSSSEGYIPHARFLCYPDYRAYQMVMYYVDPADGKKYKVTYPLTKHEKLNMSYFMNPMMPKGEKNSVSLKSGINPELISTIPDIKVDNLINRDNVLKVSKVDNPFFFPNDSTYTIGEERIIGLASVSTALSTGQVGQFALYVFATDGMYSLDVDPTGKLTYKSVSDIGRYVCNNPKSITPAIGGVFFTTDQGVMYIAGSEVKNISSSIKYNRNTPLCPLIHQIYQINGIDTVSSFTSFFSSVNIRMAYLYKTNELIIVNDRIQEYSFKFCLETGFWYRINQSYTKFLNAYPDCFAFRGGALYDIDLDSHEGENSILILSGPMSLESTNHKKIFQSVLRCDLYVKGSVGFYLMGSLDGEIYNLIGLKEIVDTESIRHCVDLVTKMKRSNSYKYISFAIAGTLQAISSINHVGITFDDSMTNRLR